MMNESARGSDFRERISPYLEVILQFSLSLTKNGRDATRLMREALEEAYRSWDGSMPEEGCRHWLHNILTRRFYGELQPRSLPPVPVPGDNIDDSLVRNNRLFPRETTNASLRSPMHYEPGNDVSYFRAVANLPAVFRSAMILSYLEGFSNREIANLAGVQPHAIESLLNRGRALLREELFAHVMGTDSFDTFADQAVASR